MDFDATCSHYTIDWERVAFVPCKVNLSLMEHLEEVAKSLSKIGAEYWSCEIGEYTFVIKKKGVE